MSVNSESQFFLAVVWQNCVSNCKATLSVSSGRQCAVVISLLIVQQSTGTVGRLRESSASLQVECTNVPTAVVGVLTLLWIQLLCMCCYLSRVHLSLNCLSASVGTVFCKTVWVINKFTLRPSSNSTSHVHGCAVDRVISGFSSLVAQLNLMWAFKFDGLLHWYPQKRKDVQDNTTFGVQGEQSWHFHENYVESAKSIVQRIGLFTFLECKAKKWRSRLRK